MAVNLFIVCIDQGVEGWTLDVYPTEEGAVERVKETYGSPFRVFRGVELDLSFKDFKKEA